MIYSKPWVGGKQQFAVAEDLHRRRLVTLILKGCEWSRRVFQEGGASPGLRRLKSLIRLSRHLTLEALGSNADSKLGDHLAMIRVCAQYGDSDSHRYASDDDDGTDCDGG